MWPPPKPSPPTPPKQQTFVRGDSFVPKGAAAEPRRGGGFADPADEAKGVVYRLGGGGEPGNNNGEAAAAGPGAAAALVASSAPVSAPPPPRLAAGGGKSGKSRQIDAFLEELKSKQEGRDYYGRDRERGDRERGGGGGGGFDRRPEEMEDAKVSVVTIVVLASLINSILILRPHPPRHTLSMRRARWTTGTRTRRTCTWATWRRR